MVCIENNQIAISQNDEALVALSSGQISHATLTNFAEVYRDNGGNKLNDEAVNMLIRLVDKDMQARQEILPSSTAFELVCHLIQRHGDFKDKELWRLASTYSVFQYGYQPKYLAWQWQRLTQPSLFDCKN